MAEIDGATDADLALIEGDRPKAAELYRARILGHPESTSSWTGLALATRNELLLSHPELVYAVHEQIRARTGVATDPDQLARWLR